MEDAGLEIDNMCDSTSELRAKLLALTGNKLDIMLDEKTFKSTTQILREFSEAYDSMSDINRSAAFELLGGKRQANVLASIVKNFNVVEDAIESSKNSMGSAAAENETYMKSIQGRIDQFKNSVQGMWTNALDSGVVKGFVDIGTEIVHLIDKIGLLKTAIIGLSAYFAGSSKYTNVFGTIGDKFTVFGHTLEQIQQRYQELTSLGNSKFSSGILSIFAGNLSGIGSPDLLNDADFTGTVNGLINQFNSLDKTVNNMDWSGFVNSLSGIDDRMRSTLLTVNPLNGAIQTGSGAYQTYAGSALSAAIANRAAGTSAAAAAAKFIGLKVAAIAASAALSFGIGLLISGGISLAAKGIDNIVHHAENLKNEVEDITSTYKNSQNEIKNNIKSLESLSKAGDLSELQKDFKYLTDGVNSNGENLRLTADEYERYKAICEKMIELDPSLAAGYDSATQAIGKQAGALTKLIEVQQARARLNAKEYVSDDNLQKIAESAINDYTKALGEYKKAKEEINSSYQNEINSLYDNNLSDHNVFTNQIIKNLADLSSLGEIYQQYYNDALNSSSAYAPGMQIAEATTKASEKLLQEHATDLAKTLSELDKDGLEKIGLNKDDAAIIANNLSNFSYEYESAMSETEDALKQAQNSLIDTMLQVPASMASYDELSSSGKSFITEWIKNSDQFKIDDDTSEATVLQMKNIIKNMVNQLDFEKEIKDAAGNKFTTSAQDIINRIFEIDPSSIDHAAFKKQIEELLGYLFQMPGFDKLNDEQKNQIKIALGIEYDIKGEDGKAPEETLVERLTEILGEDAQGFVDSLSETEVKAALKINWSAESNMTEDEVRAMLNVAVPDEVFSVKSYSELKSEIEKVNSVLKDNSDIFVDNTKLTDDQYDSLKGLIDNEELFAEAVDTTGTKIVKNASLLRGLIVQKQNDQKATLAQAQANAQLQYLNTTRQIQQLAAKLQSEITAKKSDVAATQQAISATLQNISVLRQQLEAINQTIQAYGRLAAAMSDAGQAFSAYEAAKARDAELNYDETWLDALKSISDGLLSGKVGTEEFEFGTKLIVPEEEYAGFDKLEDRMRAIQEYVKNEPLLKDWFSTKKGGDGFEITSKNINNFADSLTGLNDKLGDTLVTLDDNGNFQFTDKIKNISELTAALNKAYGANVTESSVQAMLSALEDYDGAWGNIFSDVNSHPLDRVISEQSKEVEKSASAMQKYLEDCMNPYKDTEFNKDEWDKLVKAYNEAQKAAEDAAKAAGENALQYDKADQLLKAYRGEISLTQGQVDSFVKELGLVGKDGKPIDFKVNAETGQLEATDEAVQALLAKIQELGKPTVLQISLADQLLQDQLQKLEEEKQSLENNGLDTTEIDAEIEAKKEEIADFETKWHITPAEGEEESVMETIERLGEISAGEGYNISVNLIKNGEFNKINQDVNTLQQNVNKVKNTKVTVTVNARDLSRITGQVEDLATALGEAEKSAEIKIAANADSLSGIKEQIKDSLSEPFEITGKMSEDIELPENLNANIESNAATVAADVQDLNTKLTALPPSVPIHIQHNADAAAGAVNAVATAIDSLHDKTVTITIRTVGGVPSLGGGAGFTGNAFAEGNAYKKGKIGLPKAEKGALVGELGQELVVSGNRWQTVGDHGAEMVNLPRNSIIFNHVQTKELLEHGYTNSRGKIRGHIALAEGNAYYQVPNWGSPNASGSAFDKEWGQIISGVGNSASSAAKSAADTKDETEKLIDFIEYKLENIEHIIDKTSSTIENLLDNTTQTAQKNNLYDELIKAEKEKASTYNEAVSVYTKKAAELFAEIPSQYRDMAKNGALAVRDFIGEDESEIADAIEKYRDMLNKAEDAENGYLESIAEISAKRLEQLEDIASDFENVIGLTESHSSRIQAQMDLIEESGNRLSAKFYENLKKSSEQQVKDLQDERVELQKILDSAVASGDVRIGSDDWYEMVNAIYDVDESIIECKTDIEEFQNSINDLYWDNLDKLIDRIDDVDSELEHLFDLISDDEKVVDEMGNWTKDGITALGMLAQQMEVAQFKTQQYGEAIDQLNKDYADGKYSVDEYDEKLAELKEEQWDSIEAYEKAKKAIVDLNKVRVEAVKDGIEKEISALEKLISKKKEELDLQRDARDFAKQVEEQNKNIADIEKKLAAMAGDNSAKALAERKKLEEELANAKAELEETMYQHSIDKQQEALDKQLEDYTQAKEDQMTELDESLKNEDQIIQDSYNTITGNTEAIVGNLSEIAEKYGITLSESITQPWLDGFDAIGSYDDRLNTAVSSTTDQLELLKKKMEELQAQADKTAQSIIDATTSTEKSTTSGTFNGKQTQSTPAKTTNTPKSPPSYGSTVTLKKSATNFSRDGGNGTRMQSWVPGSSFTVYQTSGSEVLIGRGGEYTGWVRLSDIQGYASGIKSVPKSGVNLIDELGEELVLSAGSDGRLQYLSKGSSVIPADLTERLMEWGELDPSRVLDASRPSVNAPHITTNNIELNVSYGEVVHIDTVTNDTLPDLQSVIQQVLNDHDKKLNQSLRKYVR